MNNNRNWVGWIAVALSGLALFVALGGFNRPTWQMQAARPAFAVPAPPSAIDDARIEGRRLDDHLHGVVGPERAERKARETEDRLRGALHDMPTYRHRDWSPAWHGPGWGAFFFWPFFFFGHIAKLVFLALAAWLIYRLFTQRRGQGPTGYSAQSSENRPHDPRVE